VFGRGAGRAALTQVGSTARRPVTITESTVLAAAVSLAAVPGQGEAAGGHRRAGETSLLSHAATPPSFAEWGGA
jgi:hypothetical protein